jgi:hypothetical protein
VLTCRRMKCAVSSIRRKTKTLLYSCFILTTSLILIQESDKEFQRPPGSISRNSLPWCILILPNEKIK